MKREEIRLRARLRSAEKLLTRWLRWHPIKHEHEVPGTESALQHQTARWLRGEKS